MIWLAWRQLRTSLFLVAGLLVAFAVAFLVTGPHLVHVYDTLVRHCATANDCGPVQSTFSQSDALLRHLVTFMVVFPALLGSFWGAPLIAREYENGTFRLAWTQGVTRLRWATTKVIVGGVSSVAAVGLFSLMATWWSSPFDRLANSPFNQFDFRGVAPMGYAAFAFALGVLFGVVIRRTLPAMAATFVGFLAFRLYFNSSIRPRFASPLTLTSAYQLPFSSSIKVGQSIPPSAWVLNDTTVNAKGVAIGENGGITRNGDINFSVNHHHATFTGLGRCPNYFPNVPSRSGLRSGSGHGSHVSIGPSQSMLHAMEKCVNSFHLTSLVTYQPASRYWSFQWYECLSFVALAAVLGACSLWWVRRH